MDDYTGPLGAGLGLAAFALVIYVALSAGAIALGIWITYTVIWRAVRRGLREYHYPTKPWTPKR